MQIAGIPASESPACSQAVSARKQWREVADEARPKVPKLAALMDDAEADVLADLGLPAQHRAKLHSTNPLERLHGLSTAAEFSPEVAIEISPLRCEVGIS